MDSLAAIPEPAQCESGDPRMRPRSFPGAHLSRRGHEDKVPARRRSKVTQQGPSWYQVRMRMLEAAAMSQATLSCGPPAVLQGASSCLRSHDKHAALPGGFLHAFVSRCCTLLKQLIKFNHP